MNRLSRVVVFAGLALIVAGLVFGLAFNYFGDHQARLVVYDAYRSTMEAIIQGEPDDVWQQHRDATNERGQTHRRAIGVHTHGINMGIVLVLLGLLTPLLGRLKNGSNRVVWGLVGAAWVYPLGLVLQFAGLTLAGQAVAALGAGVAVLALIVLFRQMSRAVDNLPR